MVEEEEEDSKKILVRCRATVRQCSAKEALSSQHEFLLSAFDVCASVRFSRQDPECEILVLAPFFLERKSIGHVKDGEIQLGSFFLTWTQLWCHIIPGRRIHFRPFGQSSRWSVGLMTGSLFAYSHSLALACPTTSQIHAIRRLVSSAAEPGVDCNTSPALISRSSSSPHFHCALVRRAKIPSNDQHLASPRKVRMTSDHTARQSKV